MLANVGTQGAFGLSAWNFLSDGWTSGTTGRAYGAGQLSLHELVYGNYGQTGAVALAGGSYAGGAGTIQSVTTGNMTTITDNLKANWLPMVIQSVAIPVGFRVGKRVMRKPITMANKALKSAGLRSMVKI